MFSQSVLDDALVEAQFLGSCSGSVAVDDVLVESLFVGLCYVLGVGLLMMFCWRHCFYGDVVRVSLLMMFCRRPFFEGDVVTLSLLVMFFGGTVSRFVFSESVR